MCKYCEAIEKDGRVDLNEETTGYSGLLLTILGAGSEKILRGRTYDEEGAMDTQDAITIHYCPFCGKKY